MINQTPESGPGATASGGSGSRADLDAYVAANAGRYTDDVIYQTLVAAGYPADDVRAALANAATHAQPRRAGTRAIRTVLIAYVAVFAILSVGMVLNGRPAGHLMPDAPGGIGILAMSLGVTFVASLIWVASRRLFGLLVLIAVALYGLSAVTTAGGGGTLLGLVFVVLAAGGALLVLRRPKGARSGGEPEITLLLAVPLLLLVGVAGICVASGLPIPGA